MAALARSPFSGAFATGSGRLLGNRRPQAVEVPFARHLKHQMAAGDLVARHQDELVVAGAACEIRDAFRALDLSQSHDLLGMRDRAVEVRHL